MDETISYDFADMRPEPRSSSFGPLDPREVERDLRRQLALIDHRVPRHIELRVREIANTITAVLPRAAELGPGSPDVYVLQRTADDYLPTALQTYLNLPGGALVAGGKTADQVLSEQLDLLSARLHEVRLAIQRKDSDALVAHGRFLEEKFGRSPLGLPGTPRPAPKPPSTDIASVMARTNALAWVSLGFGVFGVFGHVIPVIGGLTCAMVAIVTGFIARSQIKRTDEGGARLALFGIILGAVHIAVLALLFALFGAVLLAAIHSIFH